MSSFGPCSDCGISAEAAKVCHYCESDKEWHCGECFAKDEAVIKKEIEEQKFQVDKDDDGFELEDFVDKLNEAGKIKVCTVCLFENSEYLEELHPRTGGFAFSMGWG